VCGIAGEISFHGRRAERAPVGRMSESMGDRGPDGEGVWDQGWVALAPPSTQHHRFVGGRPDMCTLRSTSTLSPRPLTGAADMLGI